MTVGILKFIVWMPESNSLKSKRMVMHSLKAKLRNSFNLAVSQIADEDKWQKATLACAGVERDRNSMNSILSRAVNFIEDFPDLDLVDYEIELI